MTKIKIIRTEKESFTDCFYLVFDNGLVVKTRSLLFTTKKEKEDFYDQFQDSLKQLQEAGFELDKNFDHLR